MTARLFRTIEKGYFQRTEPPEAEQFRVFISQVNNTPNYIQDLVSNLFLFLNVDHFKSFLNLLQHCFCFFFVFLAARHMRSWHLNQDQTFIPCIGRWSLNHWSTREVPASLRNEKNCKECGQGQRASKKLDWGANSSGLTPKTHCCWSRGWVGREKTCWYHGWAVGAAGGRGEGARVQLLQSSDLLGPLPRPVSPGAVGSFPVDHWSRGEKSIKAHWLKK